MSKALGKGLSALLGENASNSALSTLANDDAELASLTSVIPVAEIHAWSDQPRRYFDEAELVDLASSIHENGVIQPIIVRKRKGKDGYEIIAGERRWRAAQMANVAAVPAVVMEADDARALEIALIENIQRRDLKPLETAEGMQQLMDKHGYTQDTLSKILGKSRSQIANTLRLLQLDNETRNLLNDELLTVGHAKLLVGHPEAAMFARKIAEQELNVRQTERLLQDYGNGTIRNRNDLPVQYRQRPKRDLSIEVSRETGLDVHIYQSSSGTGRMVIDFDNEEIFYLLRAKLKGIRT